MTIQRGETVRAIAGACFAATLSVTTLPLSGQQAAEAAPMVIRVNLPSYELEVLQGGETVATFPITIGSPSFPTHTGVFYIDRIEWNPWWNPPASPWARDEKRTAPGPRNPMGRVKLPFDGLFYVHGTSLEDEIGRALSHGCIRLANEHALEVARLIAEADGAIDAETLAQVEKQSWRTHTVRLNRPVRLELHYRLQDDLRGGDATYADVYDRFGAR